MDDRSLRRAESGSSLKIVKTSTEVDPNGVPIFFKVCVFFLPFVLFSEAFRNSWKIA